MAEAALHFPKDFLWGTATSAHQVEGDNTNNDWWAWEQKRNGTIHENQVSGKACAWWEGKAEEDIARMAQMGTNAHRLSIEWSRIEPSPGKWNYAAFDRYRAILAEMRRAGIRPMITLHHFTNPIWFAERGGWLNPEAPKLFAAYAAKATAELLDLCDMWCTINEPNVTTANGYLLGNWPPGVYNLEHYLRASLNLLLAHAAGYEVIRQVQQTAQIGIAIHIVDWHPFRNYPLDRMAQRTLDQGFNWIVLNALRHGTWRPPGRRAIQLPQLKNTLDWFGLNYYHRLTVSFAFLEWGQRFLKMVRRPDSRHGPVNWGEFYPDGIYKVIDRLHKQFNLPLYVTENGIPDGHDNLRPWFILSHLKEVWRAMTLNKNVRGYYFWSLVDNFEWAEAYNVDYHFGLYKVDFETQERTLRKSGELYAEIVKANALTSAMVERYAPEELELLFPGGAPQQIEA